MRRKVSDTVRRRQDYLRRKAMGTAKGYARRLARARRSEVRRVLDLCADTTSSPEEWAGIIDTSLSEPYLRDVVTGLYLSTGMPQARSAARDLSGAKASASDLLGNLWLAALEAYARERAGELVATVTGTLKETLRGILAECLVDGVDGVERLVGRIYGKYREIEEWQVRRIVQTETMVSLGEASRVAADSLDVGYVKQWACSGLANSRETHLAVDGVIVGRDEPFVVGGAPLMYPHDLSLSPPPGEIINCACSCVRIPD